MSQEASSRLTLLSISGKNGSENTRALSSHTTKAIASSTSWRVSGRTRADPVNTREAVAGDTPACRATSASLGLGLVCVPDTLASWPAMPIGGIGPRAIRGRPGACTAKRGIVSGVLLYRNTLMNIHAESAALSRLFGEPILGQEATTTPNPPAAGQR